MSIDLVFRNETGDNTWGQDFFARIIETATGVLKLPPDISLSVNLISPEKSQELNRQHRGKDQPTNVLSFPIQENIRNSFGSPLLTQDKSPNPTDLGDLFICLSIAKNEAKAENIRVEQKLAWLTVHGFLHLLGYDHEKSAEAEKKMFALEKKILSSLNY